MEFDRNRRSPSGGRFSRNDDRDRPERRDQGGFRGGARDGGGFRQGGGYQGGGFRDGGGGFRERREYSDQRPQPPQPQVDDTVFSERVRAGKRRTYFFDVRQTRGDDFFITITESTRRSDGYGHTRHKIFLYKEDFNRFATALDKVVNKVKTEYMPDFDYEEFDRRQAEWESENLGPDGEYIGRPNLEDGAGDEIDGNRHTNIQSEDDMAW